LHDEFDRCADRGFDRPSDVAQALNAFAERTIGQAAAVPAVIVQSRRADAS
jgi:hypothetical protein